VGKEKIIALITSTAQHRPRGTADDTSAAAFCGTFA